MNTWLLAVRGTAEPQDGEVNMLKAVYRATREPGVLYVDVTYPASIAVVNAGNDMLGASLAESLNQAEQSLRETIAKIPAGDRIVLAGYSLGAIAVLQAAAAGIRYDRIVTIACPTRGNWAPDWRRIPAKYTGIAHDYQPEPLHLDNVWHVVNPNDGITCLHPASPLRRLVPYLWALDLDDWAPWAGTVYRHLTGWQRLLDPRALLNPQAWAEALPALDGYLHGGQHTTAYHRPGWTYAGQTLTGVQVAARLVDEVAAA